MPVYKSQFNETKGTTVCKTVVLPIKSGLSGPCPSLPEGKDDIIDEALISFRCNVLHTTFSQPGPADLTLCYLTIYIGEMLRFLKKTATKAEAKKKAVQISHSNNFSIPGDDGFCLPGFFGKPTSKSEADTIRSYYRQLREELTIRLIDVIYNKDGTQNKWWFQFYKKSFMGIDKAT
uniref:Actin-related protein 2/3 complex subunit 3 n=1 Tax=Lotharella oceanica TaxID=641309 RepID=A0A7S2TVK3_9EUKA|mmetsp:Transcript_31561/g.58865  ORF Transcript_31561/g.58865 Transcript_31561/m.58865 type:complete len:177 (+) Transcript_31561:38-568(+)